MQFVDVRLKAPRPDTTLASDATLGERLRHKRLHDDLTQQQLADLIGVSQFTIINWEKGKTTPLPKDYPKLMSFLGGEMLPQGTTIAEYLRVARIRNGWSRKIAAKQLGVDESTLRDWEGGKVVLLRKHRLLVAEFLGMRFDEVNTAMREAWNAVHR